MSPKDIGVWKGEQCVMRVLKQCGSMKQLKQLQGRVVHSGFHKTPLVVGKIIEFCSVSEHADINYALRVFHTVHKPDAFMWNTIIRGFGNTLQPQQAILFYRRMHCSVQPDTFTFSFLLKIIGRLGSAALGKQLHSTILKLGLQTHTYVRNSLLHMYGLVKDDQTAHHLFDEIPNPDLVAWNSIIHCHVHCRNYKHALHVFTRMLQTGVQPDEATLVVALSACGALGALDFGMRIHSAFIQQHTELRESIPISNSLIDMYAKCGSVKDAYHIFSKMKAKNVISWNVMILALAFHGNGEDALALFAKMLQQNVERPNDVTFLGVLSACSHGGLVDESRRCIDIMGRDYNIQPTIKHYGCVVDLLGRAGLVEDAYNLIKNMPVECNAVVWRTLLAACRLHGHVELGERVRKHLLELEPAHSSDYILLANMYASTDRWNETSKERRSMKQRRVHKPEPGNSFISISGLTWRKFVETSL